MSAQRAAVRAVFALNGAVLGSWAPRIPALAEQIGATPRSLGVSLLGASAGMLVAASFSGRLIERTGVRSTIGIFTVLAALLLPLLGLIHSVVSLGAVLFFLGLAIGLANIAMNLAAVGIERQTGRPLMPTFHAYASAGALAASAAAGLAAARNVPLAQHLVAVSIVLLAVLALALPRVPELGVASRRSHVVPARTVTPLRCPKLWRLAAVALCSAVVEGACAEWSALLLIDVHRVTQAQAAYAYTAFSLGMVASRLTSAASQRRWGRSVTLAAGAMLAGSGLIAAAVIATPLVGYLGFAFAGIGVAAAFPMALSLAGELGRRADGTGGEREVAFAGTVGYTGFVAGPPVIGTIAQYSSLSACFVMVGAAALLIVLLAHGIEQPRLSRDVIRSNSSTQT